MNRSNDLRTGFSVPSVTERAGGDGSGFAQIEFLRQRSSFDPFAVMSDVVAAFETVQKRRCTPIRLLRGPFAPEYVTGPDYLVALVLGRALDIALARLASTALTAEIQTTDAKGHLAFCLREDDTPTAGAATGFFVNPWEEIASRIRRIDCLSVGVFTARNEGAVPVGIRLEI